MEGRKMTLYTLISNTKLVVEKTNSLICTTESSKGSGFQFSSVVADSMQPHGLQHASLPCPSPIPRACSKSCPFSQSWLTPSNLLILCHPLLLPSVFPSIFPRVFSSESVLHIRWSKCWSFSFSNSPSSEYSGLISFTIDWLDLLAVQRTRKSLQHHSSKASFLWCSGFFMVQLSHLCMTSGKTIALARWTFVGKLMSLLFDMLSWLVITFLPKSKHLLISWLQPPSAVILEPKNIKFCHCSGFGNSWLRLLSYVVWLPVHI